MRVAIDARKLHDFGIGTYIRNLLKRSSSSPIEQEHFEFASEHPLIRSLADYSQLIHVAFQETRL